VTSRLVVPAGQRCRAKIVAKQAGVVCGLSVCEQVYGTLDPKVRFEPLAKDGERVRRGQVLARVSGPCRSILTGERTALNFLQRLSGIATLTAEYVRQLRGRKTVILDTRKTTPGWRALEKYAVRCGGGENHRAGLYDMILVKDNHSAIAGSVTEALARVSGARTGDGSHPSSFPLPLGERMKVRGKEYGKRGIVHTKLGNLALEVEVKGLAELDEALAAGAKLVMLDNMSLAEMRLAVKRARGRAKLEASGGVNLATLRTIAATGVDYISVGALTHSAPALDISLKLER